MAVAFAEGAVTRLRREFKLLLPREEAAALSERLTLDREPNETQITSVYFDRPGFPLMARALSSPGDCLKIRTKEYFPDQAGGPARVVVEAKRERGGLTQKQRVWVPRSQLRGLFRSGELWTQVPVLDGAGLTPVLAVTYGRTVYQQSETWRVTVDRDVSFYAVEARRVLGKRRLCAALLGEPVAVEQKVVVEVKHLGCELPKWLSELKESAVGRFSKFAEGMARLHRAQVNRVQGG